jgi:hypothetical protein
MKKFLFFIATLVFCFSSLAHGYCPKTGEKKRGKHKVCYYECDGIEKVLIASSYEHCPSSIDDSEGYPLVN